MSILRLLLVLACIAVHSRAYAHPPRADSALKAQSAISETADVYTTGGDGSVYHVDPVSGRSAHLGTMDVAMAALTYDADHRVLYGLGTGVLDQQQLFFRSYLYKIDTGSWRATALGPQFIVGDGRVPGVDIVLTLAYDRPSGWIYLIQSPAPHSGNLFASSMRANPATGEVVAIATWDEGQFDNGFSYYYSASDPVDGTLWGFQYSGAWQNWSFDKVTGLPSWRSATAPAGLPDFGNLPFMGPAAFHPHSHALYRYAYDDKGNAWLYQIDLATGQATKASAPFSAPGHSMFFIPKAAIRR